MQQEQQKKNILIIKHGALGDLIQSIGLLKDIRAHYPIAKISLLTAPAYLSIMQRCPYIDQVIVDNRAPIWRVDQQLKLKKKLLKEPFDLVIDLQNSDRSRMYQQAWFSQTDWIGRSVSEPEPTSGLSGLIALLSNAGIAVPHVHAPDMEWMLDDVTGVLEKIDISDDYIVLIPGSSAAHTDKRWPHYAALATSLIDLGYEVVVALGPDEKALAKKIPGHILQGLSWFELAGVLNRAQFVVGNDTGPSHIASYLGKTGFAIFGPATSAERSEMGRRRFRTIEVEDLAALTVSEVLAQVTAHLKSDLAQQRLAG